MPLTAQQLGARVNTPVGGLLTLLSRRRGGVPVQPAIAWNVLYDADTFGLADGAAIATAPDSSGNARDATQATSGKRPTYKTGVNGHAAMRFDRTANQALTVPSGLSVDRRDVAVVLVYAPRSINYNSEVQASLVSLGASNTAWVIQGTGFVGTRPEFFNGSLRYNSGFRPTKDEFSIAIMHSSPSATIWRNNGWRSYHPAVTSATVAGATIGDYVAGGFAWSGDLAYLGIVSPAPSAATLARLEAWLRYRFATAALSRATHLVVPDGDSLTEGISLPPAQSYPNQLAALYGGTADALNYGVGGQTLVNMQADAAYEIDVHLAADYATKTLVVWGGTNDIFLGASAATTITRLQTYLAARRTAGWTRIVVLTILPRSGVGTPGTQEADRQTVNTWIRANAAAEGYVVADVGADSRIGDAGDETDLTYYSTDTTHLIAAGYAVVAGTVKAAIDTL